MCDQEKPVPQEIGLLDSDPVRFKYEEDKHFGVLLWALLKNISDWPSYHSYIRGLYQKCQNLGLTPKEIKLVFQDSELVRWIQKSRPASEQALFVQAIRLLREMGATGIPDPYNWLEPLMDFLKQGPLEPDTAPLVKEVLRVALREREPFNKGALLAYLLQKVAQDPDGVRALTRGKPTLSTLLRKVQATPLLPSVLPRVKEILSLSELQQQGRKMGLCLGHPLSAALFFVQTLSGSERFFLLKLNGRFYLAQMRLDPSKGWQVAELSGERNTKPSKRARRLAQHICEML
jgi:hypothetical protein